MKNGEFCEELLSENNIETVLATLCCYDHGSKAFEVVQKIASDQKRVSQIILVCYNLLNSQNIATKAINQSSSEKWLLQGYTRRS